MQIERRLIANVAVIAILGRLELPDKDQLIETVETVLNEKYDQILIDLSNCPYMSEDGIYGIIRIYRVALSRGSEMKFAAPTQRVLESLRIKNLLTALPILDSVEAGIKSFRPHSPE